MKRNLSTYFFKKKLSHYSFGQMLVSGVLALSIATSALGGSAYAAVSYYSAVQAQGDTTVSSSVASSQSEQMTDEEIDVDAIMNMAWYASTLGEIPEEDVEVVLSLGGSQQKLSIGIYAEREDEDGEIWNEILTGVPMVITIVCDELAELEDEDNETGHAASVEGAISVYDLDITSGTFQLGEIDPGEYTVSLSCAIENYILPEAQTVTVVEKISYEVDEDIEMEEEEEGFEDEGEMDYTVVEDTVRYVDSSSTSVNYTMFLLSDVKYWTSGTSKYLYINGSTDSPSPYKITTATKTIDGVSYEYITAITYDTSLDVDVDGIVKISTSNSTSGGVNAVSLSYTNANFAGLEPLSISVGSGASSGKEYSASTVKTLSTVTTTTLMVSSDTTGYGFMTINEGSSSSESNSTTTYYNVTYTDGMSGAAFADTTVSVAAGETPTFGGTPTLSGYTFTGWSPSETAATADITYTAQWAKTYTVIYVDGQGNTLQTVENTTDTSTSTYTNGTPTRTGYSFTGWGTASVSTDGNTYTYSAQWLENAYTVTYMDGMDDAGGSVLYTTSVTEGSTTPTCADPTRSGYTFAGWSPAVASTVTQAATYVAQWTKNTVTYTVKYTDGASNQIFADQTYTVTDVFGETIPSFNSGDYASAAAVDSSGKPTYTSDWVFTGWIEETYDETNLKIEYKANWTVYDANTDTQWPTSVTLYSNGSATDSTMTYKGSTVSISTIFGMSVNTVTSYTYSGWQTIDGVKYYYDPDTNEPVTGTQVINGTTYLFSVTGSYDSQCTGIDVSYWQGTIDWTAVKAAGVEFVIIRAGYRGYSSGTIVQDSKFTTYITGAKAAGLRVGIYFFSQAVNAQEGVEEASACINLIKSYGTNYPIYIDTELSGASSNSGRADNISNADRTAAVVAFCETVKSAGYTPGIYASYSWFTTKLNFSEVSGYSLWNAQWSSTNSMASAGMWQYTNSGSVSGISGRVDMNISYIG